MARTYTDANGKTWTIVVNVGQIKRLRDRLKLDLLASDDGTVFARLAEDPVLLVDALYVLCETQATAAGVDDEDFGAGLRGNVIDTATQALLEEIVDFFPTRKAAVLKKGTGRFRELQDLRAEMAERFLDDPALMDQVKAKIDEALRQAVSEAIGKPSTSLLGPSASTPSPTPSES